MKRRLYFFFYFVCMLCVLSFLFVMTSDTINVQAESLPSTSVIHLENRQSSVLEFAWITNEYEENIVKVLDNDTHCSMNRTYFNAYHIVINKHTICYQVVGQVIYGIYYEGVQSVLYMYHINTKEYQEIHIDATIYDITYYDEKLLLVGKEKEDACIYSFQKNLFFINKKCFGGKKEEAFYRVFVMQDYVFIFGEKDAYSEESCFSHVGNPGERKAFLIKVNEKLEIIDDFYINEGTRDEWVVDYYCTGNQISFLIRDDTNTYHQYIVNTQFEVSLKVDLNHFFPTTIYLIPHQTKENEVLYLYELDKTLYLGALDDHTIQSTYVGEYFDVYSLDIRQGNLEMIVKDNNQIKQCIVKEYHINTCNPFYYNEALMDYKSTTHFDIESYFEELSFVFDETKNSYINYQKSGTFQATYIANKLDGTTISIETDYIIPTFINIVNNGVYPTDFQLLFNDIVVVDNKRMYNGESLEEEGKHRIQHRVGEVITEYVIYVFDKENADYLIDMRNHYQDTMYTLFIGNLFYYQLEMSSPKEIKEVIVNGESHPFVYQDCLILIPIYATTPGKVDTYRISKINYVDQTSTELDVVFTVRTLCDPFQIDVDLQEDELIYQLKNNQNCLVDLVSRTYQNDVLQEEVHYNIQTQKLPLPTKKANLVLYARYTLGNQTIYEVELFSFTGMVKGKKEAYIDIAFVKHDEDLTMKIQGIRQNKIEIDDITIQKQNITKSFLMEENQTIMYIAVVASIIISILWMIFCIIQSVKKSRKTKTSRS